MPPLLDPIVVDRIMKSEGRFTIQSGKKEYFGFREDHKDFPSIHKLVRAHGIDSKEVKNRISELLTERAINAGAMLFVGRPGVQASIMSVAHLRGEGGCRAILNAVAGAYIETSSAVVTQQTIDTIANMSDFKFQERLRSVREEYDKKTYGDKIDTIVVKGTIVKGNWWALFGNGLKKRYDRERQEFLELALS